MRTFVLLPIAAAALATTAIGWGLVPAISRNTVSDRTQATSAVGPQVASGTIETVTPLPIAALRYRADACSGDYVCGDGGAWEPVAGASAEAWTPTSDGF